ncbi:MAG TPA: Shedu anti-phage system protein SduA domain-containing protein [Chitinophagaceae bacterium]|nr:Shedu anti-phage system protein SduA domain-containing protein [Chitinophagaceae bacterium]
MSIPYHLELFNNGSVRLYINFSNVKGDVADENITFHIYATNNNGIPVFTEKMGITELRMLYKHLEAVSVIKDGAKKSSKFIETTDEINLVIEKLQESDLQTVLTLLKKFESSEKIKGLLSSLSDLEIENLFGAYHHKVMSIEIDNLQKLIDIEVSSDLTQEIKRYPELIKYSAGQPEKIFQNWVETNLWVFGIDYIRKHDERKIALFSEGDLLMETVDGFLDLIELKRPKHELLKFDNSHKCYYPHSDLSIVIGQSLFYLQKLLEYKLIIQNEYKVKIIMPRVKIIVGRNFDFSDEQRNCIRMLNSNLNSIQIISYDDLILFGKLLLKANESSL